MIPFINTIMIITAILAYFVGSNYQDENEITARSIYYIENGGDDPIDGAHYTGIIALNQSLASLSSLSEKPLSIIPSTLKTFISNVTMITSAYQVNANIQTATNTNSKTLPIKKNVPEIGVDSLALIMTLNAVHQADMFDALESIVKSSPELNIESIQFSTNQITLKIKLIGLKE